MHPRTTTHAYEVVVGHSCATSSCLCHMSCHGKVLNSQGATRPSEAYDEPCLIHLHLPSPTSISILCAPHTTAGSAWMRSTGNPPRTFILSGCLGMHTGVEADCKESQVTVTSPGFTPTQVDCWEQQLLCCRKLPTYVEVASSHRTLRSGDSL